MLLASGPAHSGIVVDETDLQVAMGISFQGRSPRRAVTSVRALPDTVISRGVHGWSGAWLVNGAGDGLVEMFLDPPMKARILGFPVKVRRLTVSVEEPDALVEALSPGRG